MGQPNWNRITPNGKPFGYVDPDVQVLVDEIESLKKENVKLKRDNDQLKELINEYIETPESEAVPKKKSYYKKKKV